MPCRWQNDAIENASTAVWTSVAHGLGPVISARATSGLHMEECEAGDGEPSPLCLKGTFELFFEVESTLTLGSATALLLPSKLSYRVRGREIVLPQGQCQRRQHRVDEADQRAARWATTWWRGDGKL